MVLGEVELIKEEQQLYKHIIWDFDGTLFNTYPVMGGVFQEMLEEVGIVESLEEILIYMKVSMTYAMQHYINKYHLNNTFLEQYNSRRKETEILLCGPYAGIEDICKAIHMSGKNNYLYTHRSESAITFLKKHGLYEYFRDCITSQQGFERKPSPNAINYFVDKYHMIRDEVIMIGDRDVDIMSGKNAGIHACFFTESDEKSKSADYTISSLQELYFII